MLFGAAVDLLLVGFFQTAAGDGQFATELVEERADEAVHLPCDVAADRQPEKGKHGSHGVPASQST